MLEYSSLNVQLGAVIANKSGILPPQLSVLDNPALKTTEA
jgi:hypothetical protein